MTEINYDGGFLRLGQSSGEALSEAFHHMLHHGYGIIVMRRQNTIHIKKEDYANFAKWLKDFDDFIKTNGTIKIKEAPILTVDGIEYKWNDKDENE